MREIKIKIPCNKKTCGNCWYVTYSSPLISCQVFTAILGREPEMKFRRCKECFIAEKEANNA